MNRNFRKNAFRIIIAICVVGVAWVELREFWTEYDPVITGDSREEIRLETGVRELRPPEIGKNIDALPDGVFGYASPFVLGELEHIGYVRLRGDGGDDPRNPMAEIHKTSEGKIVVLVYVSRSDLEHLRDPKRVAPFSAHAFMEKDEEHAQALIGLPFSLLKMWHSRSEDAGDRRIEFFEIKVH